MSKKKFPRQKKQKSKQYLFEEILKFFKDNPGKSFNYKQVSSALKINDEKQRQLIQILLNDLLLKEQLISDERGKYKNKHIARYITGKVDMTRSGSAYIVSDDAAEDIFISAKKLKNALQGDTVKVYLIPGKPGRKQEGEIVEIIERNKTNFVGTIQLSQRFAFLVPDSIKSGPDIYIPLEKLNKAKDGDKAVAKIIEWPVNALNPIGEVIELLGKAGDNQTEMHAILAEFGLPYKFPPEVEKFATKIPTQITSNEIAKRKDFRNTTTFTIDPADAKDFDDALSVLKLGNGNYEIGVHIADVTHYLKEESIIDVEAFSRATSVYLVDRVVPMLPEVLSNNVCSLVPNEDRLCFSAVFEIDSNAAILNEWFGRTIIHSNKRFTYEEAQKVIETETGDYSEEILLLNNLASKLRANRMKKGSIAFDKLEVKFNLDKDGNPTGVFFKHMKDSNKLIEDFMLLANRRVADFIGRRGAKKEAPEEKSRDNKNNSLLPFVYRIHDKPNEDKLHEFAGFISKFGYKLNLNNEKTIADSMNKLLEEVSEKPEGNAIEMLAIRSMSKAVYSTNNVGHYGLGFPFYTHFTSPIRRYPDVMVHRLLQHYLDGGKPADLTILEEKCKHSSDMEKLAADAERASIKYKQVQFLQDKIGEEFDGHISGVTEWGIFVEITENLCEGMIRLRDMTDDSYYFDDENYCIVGRRYKTKLTLGDRVRIQIKKADLIKKQLDFTLLKIYSKQENLKQEKPKKSGESKSASTDESSFKNEWGFEV